MVEVHPKLRALLDQIEASGEPPVYELSPADARERVGRVTALASSGPDVRAVKDVIIDSDGAAVGARLYEPAAGGAGGTIVYLHGGGWVTGSIDNFDPVCRSLCAASGLTLVSVGYRLAPEHPYPAGLNDAVAALRWARERLGSEPLVIAGDSAGGNLAAACALLAERGQAPRIDLQVLLYPVTDHDLGRASYLKYGGGEYMLTTKSMEYYWSHYAPDVQERADPLLSPLRAGQLSGIAPAIFLIAGYDPLRDEQLNYASRLTAAGVDVEILRYDDMLHGFLMFVGYIDTTDLALRDTAEAINSALARSAAAGQ